MGVFQEFSRNIQAMNKNLRWFMWCVFFNGIVMSSTGVMLGIYYKDIGMSEGVIGNLLSLRTIGVSAGAFLAMVLVEAIGTKRSLFLSFVSMAISGFIFVNILWMPVLQISSLAFGVAQGIYNVIQSPFLRKNSCNETVVGNFSASFVISNCAMFLGNLGFGLISDALAQIGGQRFGRQLVMNLSFIALCLGLVCLQKIDFSAEVSIKTKQNRSFSTYFSILNTPLKLYMIKVALVGAGAGLICPFFSVYIKETLQVSDSVVGIIMSISQFGTVMGGLFVPYLSRRFGRVNTIIACQLLSIPFLLSISFPQGIVLMTISFFFRSSFMNMANPIIESLAMDLVDEKNRTIMSSIFMLTNHMFRAVGTSIGGYVMQNISYNTPYYYTIVMYLLSTMMVYLIFGRKPKTQETQD